MRRLSIINEVDNCNLHPFEESIARAEAITREAQALRNNPELIRLRAIEQWDGVLPKFSGGGTIPLLNIDMESLNDTPPR